MSQTPKKSVDPSQQSAQAHVKNKPQTKKQSILNVQEYSEQDQENFTLLRSYLHFIPFMAKLLSGQKPEHHLETVEILTESKSLRHSELLSQEALQALQEMMVEVVFDQLKTIGVRKRRCANVRHRTVQISRMWKQNDWEKLSLEFTDHSIDLAILIYQLYHAETKQQQNSLIKELKSLDTPSMGDLLFQFILYQHLIHLKKQVLWRNSKRLESQQTKTKQAKLNEASKQAKQAKKVNKTNKASSSRIQVNTDLNPIISYLYQTNPLISLVNIDSHLPDLELDQSKQYNFDFKTLKATGFRTIWPWFGQIIVNTWIKSEKHRWESSSKQAHEYTQFYNISQRQSALIEQLISFAEQEDRYDLLLPLITYYQELVQTIDQDTRSVKEKVNQLCLSLLMANRASIISPYECVLNGINRLAKIAQEINQSHPMDREWSEILFLSVFQAAELESTINRINQVINDISPKVG